MTIPLLDRSRRRSRSELIGAALKRILRDEVPHAQLGGWFLDWADTWLLDDERIYLGQVAGRALRAFVPLLEAGYEGEKSDESNEGMTFGAAFARAAEDRVARPLRRYGIEVPPADLGAVR